MTRIIKADEASNEVAGEIYIGPINTVVRVVEDGRDVIAMALSSLRLNQNARAAMMLIQCSSDEFFWEYYLQTQIPPTTKLDILHKFTLVSSSACV